jgi:putative hydrolase of the HAD superfamily
MGTRFDVIGLDADDTLWHSEDSFYDVESRYIAMVQPYVAEGINVRDALRATERRHVPISGYGVKAFTLSMVECAVGVSQGSIPAAVIGDIVTMGLDMLIEPVRLLAGVPQALADLGRDHRLVMITKGDLVHQWRKVELSGLAHLFDQIEVVTEKDEAVYRRVLDEVGVKPGRFCMVGNSVRSDVLPVLALGAAAIHVPYRYTWDHELAEHDGSVLTAATLLDAATAIRQLS